MQHINIFTKSRWLVTIILLTTLSIGTMWGAGAVSVTSSAVTFPLGSTTVSNGDWATAGAPSSSYPTTATDYTINKAGSWTLLNASDYNSNGGLQVKASGGYIETTITSPAGVDVVIGYKVGNNNFVTSLDGASNNVSGNSTSYSTMSISTPNTSAKLKILKNGKGAGYISYITITPKAAAACSATPTIGAASLNGSFTLTSVPFTATVSNEGGTGCSISAAGFVWKTGSNPSSSDNPKAGTYTSSNKTITGTLPSSGSFSTGTTYYVKAYATNGAGTAVSSTSYQFRPQSISYNGNTSTSGSMSTQYVEYNKAANLTSNGFSKTGHTFSGWATTSDGAVAYTNGQSVTATSNLSLYAKWSKNSYTLTWDLNGGTVSVAGTGAAVNATGSPSSSVPYGDAITAPTVTKTGYTQNGWNTTPASTMPASNTTYTAQWTANKYDITYKDQGGGDFSGTQTNAPTQHTYGTATTLKIPTKTGYTFNGWFTTSACSAGSEVGNTTSASLGATAYTAAIILYAKWTKNSYTLTWNLNGGKVTVAGTGAVVDATGTPNTSVPYNDAITAPTVTKYGYTFSSWNTTPASTMPAGATTYTAQWTAKSFTVTWMVNGVAYTTGDPSNSVSFDSHVAKLPTAPTPPCGNKFMGWTTVENVKQNNDTGLGLFTTAAGAPTIMVEGNVTYYAVFADYAE